MSHCLIGDVPMSSIFRICYQASPVRRDLDRNCRKSAELHKKKTNHLGTKNELRWESKSVSHQDISDSKAMRQVDYFLEEY